MTAILTGVRWYLTEVLFCFVFLTEVLIRISLKTKDAENLYRCLIAQLYIRVMKICPYNFF